MDGSGSATRRDALSCREHRAAPAFRGVVEPRDVYPDDFRREPEQRLLAVEALALALFDRLADLRHDVFAVAERDEVDEIRDGLRVARRRRSADENERPRAAIHVPRLVRLIVPFPPRQRHPGQRHHLRVVPYKRMSGWS